MKDEKTAHLLLRRGVIWRFPYMRSYFILHPSSFILFFCYLFCFSWPAFALSVALKSDATVADPMITIGDVATVTGEGADAITALDLGPAPKPGVERRFTAAAIASRIRGTGLANKSLDVTGAPAVRITGPCERVTRDLIAEDLRLVEEHDISVLAGGERGIHGAEELLGQGRLATLDGRRVEPRGDISELEADRPRCAGCGPDRVLHPRCC